MSLGLDADPDQLALPIDDPDDDPPAVVDTAPL